MWSALLFPVGGTLHQLSNKCSAWAQPVFQVYDRFLVMLFVRAQGAEKKKQQSADTRHNMNKDWIHFQPLING